MMISRVCPEVSDCLLQANGDGAVVRHRAIRVDKGPGEAEALKAT